ncbi:MAG: aminopeptidase P family protein [Verrucomicrobiae bacterium]|nr:aminopeptidase P family protein [Verrucomicrobiae bacterium]
MADPIILLAGVPQSNMTLYHRIRFSVGDSAAWIGNLGGAGDSLLLVRDIEMERARKHARAGQVACAADFVPEGGLSGDRDTALAQATAECLRRAGARVVVTDRTLPFLFAWHLQQAGLEVQYDADLGVLQRRVKDDEEIAALTKAQQVTMESMQMACSWIATASADASGVLHQGGDVLTSERVRRRITQFLIERGFSNSHDSIVATVPHVADCHHFGTGPLVTGIPVIVDIFPRDDSTGYNGDCTRTVVHGTPTDAVKRMHEAVVAAKAAGCGALRAGTTGEAVHRATIAVIAEHGFAFKRGSSNVDDAIPAMRHGTGHGIGLDVHEPILLDDGGGEILSGEVFTVEPGLYSASLGGVRVEDMVWVNGESASILGALHEGLSWD